MSRKSPLSGRRPPTREDMRPDYDALSFEATQLFSPSTPIGENELFAGRGHQIRKMLEATGERGKHVVLYGERGVGKTSLARVFTSLFPTTLRHIHAVREQADPTDNFDSLWRKVFRDLHIKIRREGEDYEVPISDFYETQITPDDVRRELDGLFRPNDIPVIVIDEYDKVRDADVHELMANTIKSLSDYGVNCTVILVGVADDVNSLIGEHESVVRCLEQILMPRMNRSESKEILQKIIPKLGMKIEPDAENEIVDLSSGLPTYVHSIGLQSVQAALDRRSINIGRSDVGEAVGTVLEKSQESIRDQYAKAVHSNRGESLYREVLLACALAETDDRGTFTPSAVVRPLSDILGREVQLSSFHPHLQKFISDERGSVLTRRGRPKGYRFRFRDPMMQPFTIMKGREQGLIEL